VAPVTGPRLCACGCGTSLAGRRDGTLYVDHAHAQRAYRRRLRAALAGAGLPTSLSLRMTDGANGTPTHHGDSRTRSCEAREARSGLQLSYPKAVRVLADAIAPTTPTDADALLRADLILRQALPARQRAKLAKRA
jgi:hypothetical protein